MPSIAILLFSLSNPYALAQNDEDIVESFGGIVDTVEQDLREGDTDAEAGRNFLERTLDFFKGIVLTAYDAVSASLSGSDDSSVTLDEFNQLLLGTNFDRLVESLGQYSNSTVSTTVDANGNTIPVLELHWINEDGAEVVAVLVDGELVELDQSGLE